jgi:site-specific recombinase XerD
MVQSQDEAILIKFEESLTRSALAPTTIVNYLADLRTFLRWGQQQIGSSFTLAQVGQDHIRLYRYHLAQELHRASATVNRHLMALRKLFAWAKEVGYVPVDPTTEVSLVQEDGQAPSRPLSGEEVEQLLLAAHNGSRAGLARRDVAILQLLVQTGLRVSEIVALQQQDVVFDDPGVQLKVHRHPNDQYLPLPNPACKALTDYLQVRPQTAATSYLFLCQDGRPISQRTVQRIINDCAKVVGLDDVSAQSLRRTFAMQLLAQTGDLDLVSERLGHQTKAITEQYLSVHSE